MKLQILVPQYKEDESVVKDLLDSIMIQQGISFDQVGVIIVNDHSDVILAEEFLNRYYKLDIQYSELSEHKGVSAVRNECLRLASADYIMFCDADDMFYNATALWSIFKEIEAGPFDGLYTKFVEEVKDENGQSVFIYHNNDGTFVHGKVYNRKFLLDNDIKWNEDLTVHEDSYFNFLAMNVSEGKLRYLDSPIYLWKSNPNSVCRSDRKYFMLKTYPNLLDSSDALVEELVKRNKKEQAAQYVVRKILETYYTLNEGKWLDPENIEYRNKVEERTFQYLFKYQGLWNSVEYKEKIIISNSIREDCINKGMMMENITFNNWIQDLVDKYR